MKKLEPKIEYKENKVEKLVSKADLILNKARREIKDFIVYEMALIYNVGYKDKIDFGKGEEFSILPKNLITDDLGIIAKIILTLDDNIFLIIDDNEYEWDDMNTDDLCHIANFVEEEYNKLIKK